MLKGLDTSAILYTQALVPAAISAAGSTTAVDLSNYTLGTLLLTCGSTGAATITANVLKCATSGGTFNGFGASVNAAIKDKTHVRSFVIGGSTGGWYKVHYTATGGGSPIVGIYLIASGAREMVIDQSSNTTSYSVINSA